MPAAAELDNVVETISLLYELSLSIGLDIDLEENCSGFLRTLLARKNLGYGSVWIHEAQLEGTSPPDSAAGAVRLVHANPRFRIQETALPADHPVFARLQGRSAYSIASTDDSFGDLVTERQIVKGAFTVFALGQIGYLKLYSMTQLHPFSDRELNQLRHVMSKFTTSLAGSIAHRKMLRELAERERAEQALREEQERLESVTHDMGAGLAIISRDFRTLWANKVLKQLFGDEIEGKLCYMTYNQRNQICAGCGVAQVLTEGRDKVVHEQFGHDRRGNPIWSEIIATPIRNRRGEVTGVLELVVPINERKRAEEERKALQLHLQRAERMEAIGTLAGGIAHDFNNLLMAIQGNVSCLMLDLPPADLVAKGLLSDIVQQVKSGAMLAKQLLGYARKGRYEVKPLDLNPLVKKTAETFQRTRKQIRLACDLNPSLWPAAVDWGQIEQVLYNLFVNAADAMPNGGLITIRTDNLSSDRITDPTLKPAGGRLVVLEVTDTGTGMSEETMEHLFEPFYTTKEMGRGTGLGLASVYGIVTSHGGTIKVKSVLGCGATFSVHLPATTAAISPAPRRPVQLESGFETLLVVDDEEMVLAAHARLLRRLGYVVHAACGGHEAIATYQAELGTIDLVILDMIMPAMGGGETFDRLKEIDPDVRVLLSSGYSIEGQATEIANRGCMGFIQKPFDEYELSAKLREILDGPDRQRREGPPAARLTRRSPHWAVKATKSPRWSESWTPLVGWSKASST